MMVFSPCFISIALLLLLLSHKVASSEDVIDNKPLRDGSIVDQLCDHSVGQSKRISRISTISELHGYFNSLTDTEQASCRILYLEPLTQLKALLDVESENVCGPEMMEQINKFHWHYVVGGLSKRWRKASNGTLPKTLKVFFMNYAQEVTEKCKDTLMERLELAAENTNILAETLYTNKFGLIINRMSDILQPQKKIRKHDDFLLLWDQLIDKERKKGRSVEQKIDPATGETVLLSFKVRDPESVWFIQKKCRQDLRPVYKQTVLPVMRLISIGYGKEERHSRKDVAGSELVKNWYAIAQLCQLILPINFYMDKSLKHEQATVMSTEETTNFPSSEDSLVGNEIPTVSIEIEPIQLEDILPNAANNQIATLVKSNLKARSHVFRIAIRNAIRMTNGQLKSKLKNLFISRRIGENKYVIENGESIIDGPLADRADELLLEDDDTIGGKLNALVRNKRGLSTYIYCLAMIIVIGIPLSYLLFMTITVWAG